MVRISSTEELISRTPSTLRKRSISKSSFSSLLPRARNTSTRSASAESLERITRRSRCRSAASISALMSDNEIVVYCMNEECESSREEARELQEMGYQHVLHYAGGKQGWIKAGLPVEGRRDRR
jgi:rhodanese-related sulfurtransferase